MLRHLHIENYALIEKLAINFNNGLTVITGETGAGKSILLGALSLILGQRADTQVLNDNSRKCIIEGSFDISEAGLEPLFDYYQLDFEPVSLFRREITPQGKSRAFVNDTPVTLQVLKEMSEKIIDIHSQHQNLLLGESSFQFDVIDSYAGIIAKVISYRQLYRKLQQEKTRLAEMEEQELRSKTDLDYYQFQLDELDKSELNADRFRGWESEIEVIRNAEEIRNSLQAAAYLLSESDINAGGLLYETLQHFKPLTKYSTEYKNLADRVDSVLIEIRDIVRETEKLSGLVAHDPEMANELEMKLDAMQKLFMKHHVSSVEELIAIRKQYEHKINAVQTLEQDIDGQRKLIDGLMHQMMTMASTISETRKKTIPQIEKELLAILRQLGMPGASLKLDHQLLETLSVNGCDRIRFLFSANPGADVREVSRVASGGEISRLMLCVKSMISKKKHLPSIVFDEIDTGISGEVGGKIGDIMQGMAVNMQVITITHLPQIAARGSDHFVVYKTVEAGKTKTKIRVLNKEEQIGQVAKMLGGDHPTPNMLKTAEELIINK
jgi:DNA repair protein RecN (Recombination protein N)